ncbi:MAG: TMEM165/GDT1 family protein [Dehalococcoidia bacterium]|jgi:putative Ca2+/H+ antiporter (TMEM165/GDT1 family)|nr:TMEM165/GDT1 family protein [Dehalococcoidia bacterium]
MTAFFTSLLLVALAEMADKTQFLTLSLACRYRVRDVIVGVGVSIAALNALAVTLGAVAGRFIPVTAVKVGAGVLFIGFGLWTLLAREKPESAEDSCDQPHRRRWAALTVAGAFFIAELGDKTQLATLSLAARFDAFFLVWLGATLGMFAANGLAIALGVWAGRRLPERWLKRLSAALFIAFGVWTLVEVLARS